MKKPGRSRALCGRTRKLLRGNYLNVERRGDVLVQAHRDLVLTERLDRVTDLDLAAVELRTTRGHYRFGDLRGLDGAEEPARVTGTHLNNGGEARQQAAHRRG